MSRYCHETGQGIKNPFYFISAVCRVDKESGRLLFSDLELSLSREIIDMIPLNTLLYSHSEIEEDFFYILEKVIGEEGGFTGLVQTSFGHEKDPNFKYYLSRELANSKLPKSARDLLNNPSWLELIDGEYKPVQRA